MKRDYLPKTRRVVATDIDALTPSSRRVRVAASRI
jgi:hypothetical protein